MPPPRSFAYSVAPGNCGGAAGLRGRGRAGGGGEPPGPRTLLAPGQGRRERRCSGDTPTHQASSSDSLTCGADFHSWSWGECFEREGGPPLGARRQRRGRRGATGTLVRPRGEVVMASPQLPHSESSRQEEPPWGGSVRLGERKEKRESRRGEPRAELASPAAAYAPTAPPRLRRRRRPPRGPPPEARWRQFRCPDSPDVQASPLRQAVRARRRCGRGRRGGSGGGVREPAPSLGGAWGTRDGRALPRLSAVSYRPETTRRGWTPSTTPSAGPCRGKATTLRG